MHVQAVTKLFKSQKKWIEMNSAFNIRFETDDRTLLIPINKNGIEKDGWQITPRRMPLQVL